MDTAEIRRRFTAHFEAADHTVVPSASLLLDDPTLLFVNAGMVPFKPYFLGQETPPYSRATSVQKCVRTLDIEDVGKTTRHGTFFQMCGNFSFGDYFKAGAIELAWSLITNATSEGGYGFDADRIWVTVLEGDDESIELWRSIAELPLERIQRRGLLDNYWHMGVPGPGGPCSEIYYDRGPDYGPDGGPIVDEDRFLEIWNLVFMQESLSQVRAKDDFDVEGPLPAQNIDTGMGLERVAYLLQNKDNMYEIDEIFPVIAKASELTGVAYGTDPAADVRFRVIADHVRSGLMLIGDGVRPGNEGRGYVLRRLLRRAVRSMRILGFQGETLPQLLPVSLEKMALGYPELAEDFARIESVAYAEEATFGRTLEAGTHIFDQAVASLRQAGTQTLGGAEAFALHDTYGFPIDLTLEMAAEEGLKVDEAGFRQLMAEQRARAQADAQAKKGQHADVTAYRAIIDAQGPTDWLAYERLDSEAVVQAILSQGANVDSLVTGEVGEVVLNRTPFFAESGGQAADAGTMHWDGGALEVLDVQRPVAGLVVHQVRITDGELHLGATVSAQVDPSWRTGARQAHSGTHIVHAALREVLGPTALQAGSYNRPGYLRLDYGWNERLNPDQLHQIEVVSNQALREDLAVSADYMTLQQAREAGALALFGETYDSQRVRVVEIGGRWSRELCGGTHVERSSQIGTIVLTSDSSIGSGNRRVEAFVGLEGFQYLAKERDLVHDLTTLLKVQPDQLTERVGELVQRLHDTEKTLEKLQTQQLLAGASSLAQQADTIDGVLLVAHVAAGLDGGAARTLATEIKERLPTQQPGLVALIGVTEGRGAVVAAANEAALTAGLSARDLLNATLGPLGGKGGGRDELAQGGVGQLTEETAATGLEAARQFVHTKRS